LKEFEHDLKVTIFSSGSEVEIALNTAKLLEEQLIGTRVISAPCIELLFKQDPEYIMMLTCNPSLKVAIEAAVSLGWERLIGPHGLFIGMQTFGASGKAADLYNHFGITAQKCFTLINRTICNIHIAD
jgi:transketolase